MNYYKNNHVFSFPFLLSFVGSPCSKTLLLGLLQRPNIVSLPRSLRSFYGHASYFVLLTIMHLLKWYTTIASLQCSWLVHQLAMNAKTHRYWLSCQLSYMNMWILVSSNMLHVPSQQQLADPLTKPLPRLLFQALIGNFGTSYSSTPNLRGSIRGLVH